MHDSDNITSSQTSNLQQLYNYIHNNLHNVPLNVKSGHYPFTYAHIPTDMQILMVVLLYSLEVITLYYLYMPL